MDLIYLAFEISSLGSLSPPDIMEVYGLLFMVLKALKIRNNVLDTREDISQTLIQTVLIMATFYQQNSSFSFHWDTFSSQSKKQ